MASAGREDGSAMTAKRCSKCGKEKPLEEFHRRRRSPDGRTEQCKPCCSARQAAYRAKDPERVREMRRESRLRDLGHTREVEKKRRERNAENRKPYSRRYKEQNKEKTRAHSAVARAVRSGELTRPSVCDRCNQPHQRIDAHHADYAQPLSVEWLCPFCHKAHHVRLAQEGVAA